jgi:hypothetical protein
MTDSKMNYTEIKYTFFGFLGVMTFLGLGARSLGFDVMIYGETLIKHISDLMSEHEAIKSLNILSIGFIIISFITALYTIYKKPNPKFYLYFLHPMLNFICTLAAVSLAITVSVFISSLGMYGAFPTSLILLFINFILTASLLSSVYYLNLRPVQFKNIVKAILSTFLLIIFLFRLFFWD